jgi:hypothetical protein
VIEALVPDADRCERQITLPAPRALVDSIEIRMGILIAIGLRDLGFASRTSRRLQLDCDDLATAPAEPKAPFIVRLSAVTLG